MVEQAPEPITSVSVFALPPPAAVPERLLTLLRTITSALIEGDDAARPDAPEPLLSVAAGRTILCGSADVQRGEEVHIVVFNSLLNSKLKGFSVLALTCAHEVSLGLMLKQSYLHKDLFSV